MATERELKIQQEEKLFDLLKLVEASSEEEMRMIAADLYARAQSGMTVEEIAAVKERLAISKGLKPFGGEL